MANLFSVKDKVVVITGGTGVLGKAIAAHLAEEGAKVILLGRKTEVGNKIVESIRTQGGEALFLTTDVLDRKILEQNLHGYTESLWADRCITQCGRRQYAGSYDLTYRRYL